MNLGKKCLELLIAISVAILITLLCIYYFELPQDRSEDDQLEINDVKVSPNIWNELIENQSSDGSWDNDLETTQIASNALTQSIDIVQNSNIILESDTDNLIHDNKHDSKNNYTNKTANSVKYANNWTMNTYSTTEPIMTQSLVNYNIGLFLRRVNHSEKMNYLTTKTNDIILNSQSDNGSWNNDIAQTGISLFVLKKSSDNDTLPIQKGESWLYSQQINNSWGSILNDSLALLGLHNSTYDAQGVIEQIIKQQDQNGSFGDIETTAWVVIVLSIYDHPEYYNALESARIWLLDQNKSSNRELAMVSLAESEYLINEINKLETFPGTYDLEKDKGPPQVLLLSIYIIAGNIFLFTIIFIRLSESDALQGRRQRIYDYVKAHPGISQNALMRRLNVSSSSLRHHLRILEKYDFILQHIDGKYIRYYINKNGYSLYTNGNGYKEVISVLRKDTASEIVRFIMKNPNTTQQRLAGELNLHPSTIHWHTKLLIATNIISSRRKGKSVQYQINEPNDMDKLLALAS